MRRVQMVIAGILLVALSGCGYTFSGGGSVLPPDVKKVAIPLVDNSSTETGLSTVVTEALRDQFERFGVLTVVEEESEADAVLNARILRVQRETSAVEAKSDAALQRDTTMTLAAELRRTDGPVLWRNTKLVVTKPVAASSDASVPGSAFLFHTCPASSVAKPSQATRGTPSAAAGRSTFAAVAI